VWLSRLTAATNHQPSQFPAAAGTSSGNGYTFTLHTTEINKPLNSDQLINELLSVADSLLKRYFVPTSTRNHGQNI